MSLGVAIAIGGGFMLLFAVKVRSMLKKLDELARDIDDDGKR